MCQVLPTLDSKNSYLRQTSWTRRLVLETTGFFLRERVSWIWVWSTRVDMFFARKVWCTAIHQTLRAKKIRYLPLLINTPIQVKGYIVIFNCWHICFGTVFEWKLSFCLSTVGLWLPETANKKPQWTEQRKSATNWELQSKAGKPGIWLFYRHFPLSYSISQHCFLAVVVVYFFDFFLNAFRNCSYFPKLFICRCCLLFVWTEFEHWRLTMVRCLYKKKYMIIF